MHNRASVTPAVALIHYRFTRSLLNQPVFHSPSKRQTRLTITYKIISKHEYQTDCIAIKSMARYHRFIEPFSRDCTNSSRACRPCTQCPADRMVPPRNDRLLPLRHEHLHQCE